MNTYLQIKLIVIESRMWLFYSAVILMKYSKKIIGLFQPWPPVFIPHSALWLALHCTAYHHMSARFLLVSSDVGESLSTILICVPDCSGPGLVHCCGEMRTTESPASKHQPFQNSSCIFPQFHIPRTNSISLCFFTVRTSPLPPSSSSSTV